MILVLGELSLMANQVFMYNDLSGEFSYKLNLRCLIIYSRRPISKFYIIIQTCGLKKKKIKIFTTPINFTSLNYDGCFHPN